MKKSIAMGILKLILNSLLFIIFIVLSFDFWDMTYKQYAAHENMVLPYILMTAANLGISICVVAPIFTKLFSVKLAAAAKSKKAAIISVVAVIALTAAMTAICHWWLPYGYGPIR